MNPSGQPRSSSTILGMLDSRHVRPSVLATQSDSPLSRSGTLSFRSPQHECRPVRGKHAGIATPPPRGVSSYFHIGRALCSATLTNSALPRYSRVLWSRGAKLKFRQEPLTMFDRASSRCLSSRRMAITGPCFFGWDDFVLRRLL